MIYENMSMMIFMLASGYLLTVYLLLALAKRTGKKPTQKTTSLETKGKDKQKLSVPKVTEATSMH